MQTSVVHTSNKSEIMRLLFGFFLIFVSSFPLYGFPGNSDSKESATMQDNWVQSLGWEDLEKRMATHSSILAWRIPWKRGAWQATVHGVAENRA